MMSGWRRQEHAIIVSVLKKMDAEWLLRNKCWFAGGTAVVLLHGEYRLSKDMDFLCDDADGYRELRMRAVRHGVRGFFSSEIEQIREFRFDQYGLRCAIGVAGHVFRFEIIRETRISLSGRVHDHLGVPVLAQADLIAEKMLANADRGFDRATGGRDIVDLGVLLGTCGCKIPREAAFKTQAAYGEDVWMKLDAMLARLADPLERAAACASLGMERSAFDSAIECVEAARTAALDADVAGPSP